MPKDGEPAKCEKNLVWTWQSSYAGKHDKFAGVAISPDKKFIIASGVRGSKSKACFQNEVFHVENYDYCNSRLQTASCSDTCHYLIKMSQCH